MQRGCRQVKCRRPCCLRVEERAPLSAYLPLPHLPIIHLASKHEINITSLKTHDKVNITYKTEREHIDSEQGGKGGQKVNKDQKTGRQKSSHLALTKLSATKNPIRSAELYKRFSFNFSCPERDSNTPPIYRIGGHSRSRPLSHLTQRPVRW